jgi:hypothetical protein
MSEKLKDYLIEGKEKLKPKLSLLDDKIEKFIEMLEKRVDNIEDNPVFQRKMNQLLVDMSKEHGEFILALRSVVAALDRGAQVIPSLKRHKFDARGVRPDEPTEFVEEPEGEPIEEK